MRRLTSHWRWAAGAHLALPAPAPFGFSAGGSGQAAFPFGMPIQNRPIEEKPVFSGSTYFNMAQVPREFTFGQQPASEPSAWR